MAEYSIYKPTNTWLTGTELTYYKMVGYYVAGAVYEVYVVTNTPTETPPSGHILTNVAILAIWQE